MDSYYSRNKERIKARAKARYHGLSPEQRAHRNEVHKKWLDKNRDRYTATVKRWYDRNQDRVHAVHILRRYGITMEEFQQMVEAQNGLCAICAQPPKGKHYLSVDHSHATGKVRGLLCDNCNKGIGNLQDSPEVLEKAAAYLRSKRD